jgi:hypothetical protein
MLQEISYPDLQDTTDLKNKPFIEESRISQVTVAGGDEQAIVPR